MVCILLVQIYHYLDKNPVFTYDETALNEEVKRIREAEGDPITAFLTSEEYKSISCSALESESIDGPDGPDDNKVRRHYTVQSF